MSGTGTDLTCVFILVRHLNAFESIFSVETRLPCSLVDENVVALGGVAGTAASAAALGGDSIDIWNIGCIFGAASIGNNFSVRVTQVRT